MITFFDLESLPTNDPGIIADLEKTIAAPATHKKQETIDKWIAENKDQELKNLIAKTSFDGMYGRIACIAWACGDGDIHSTGADDTEKEAICKFYDYLSFDVVTSAFCGHNIHAFDLQFLKHRSIILGIKPPESILKVMDSKPWDDCIKDTMLMWSSDKQRRVSMDKLSKALGIAGKNDFNGSMVADTWPIDPQKVIDYCINDVAITRQIYKRLTFNRG